MNSMGELKFYWVSALIQNDNDEKPWTCALYDSIVGFEEAKEEAMNLRKKHTVLSVWIDTYEDNVKQTVFHECYVNALGHVSKPEESTDDSSVEIDENILPVIIELNSKGYITRFCCEGHVHYGDNNEIHAVDAPYISFAEGVHLPSCPEGWKLVVFDTAYDEDDNEIKGYWECIYAMSVGETETSLEYYKEKLNMIIKLIDWVSELETLYDWRD